MRENYLRCVVGLLIAFSPGIVLGEEKIRISEGEVRMEDVKIQSKTIGDNNSVQTNIQVGTIVNRSSGGNSEIHIGTVDNSADNTCAVNDISRGSLEISRVISSNQNISVKNTSFFDLCISGVKNKVKVDEISQISTLLVLGSENKIRITKGAKVKKIHIKGERNTIYVPKSEKLNIVDSGEGNTMVNF